MSVDPLTSIRIYERLKADVMSGRFPPRTVLIERVLAREYNVSVSPFRNGAFRLVAEKHLELHPGGGFQVPDVTVQSLSDLYFWHSHLVRNALHHKRRLALSTANADLTSAVDQATPGTIAAATARIFARIADQSPNIEHRNAIIAAGERLNAARLKELLVLKGVAGELEAVQALTVDGRMSDLVRAIWAYHRRRLRRIVDIVIALGGTPDESETD